MKRTPGTVVIQEIPHAEFQVDGQRFRVDELVWNNISGRSFDLVCCDTGEVLTVGESFDRYPTDEQIASVLEEHGVGQTFAASRVQLGKAPAEYLVIADDGPAVDDVRAGRTPERRVRHVERRAVHPVERQLQWDELAGACLDAGETVRLLTCTAVSHGHAAHVARREFAAFNAAVRMGDEIDRHLERGERGWLAIRIDDGGSDGELYGDRAEAFAAQEQPEACTYFPISPLLRWTPRMCAEHLEFMTHLRHGCMVHGRPTCH